jgi:hypothetical protein
MTTLGTYSFDERHTSVTDTVDEVAGRTRRVFVVSGLIVDKMTETDIIAELDAIADAASEGRWTSFSIRSGRDFTVERIEMSRRVDVRELIGSFTLRLGTRDPFELDTTVTEAPWSVTSSGATKAVAAGGNLYSEPAVEIVASGDVVNPAISDGSQTVQYWGTVADGETLLFDADARTVTLEGVDVMPYTTGEFPRVSPEGTTLTYTDDASSSHTASVTVSWKDRWW